MSDITKISVIRKSQPIDLEIEEGREVRVFVKEMTGAQRDEYLNKVSRKTKTNDKGEPVGLTDYTGSYSLLLSFCLYDADGKSVPEKTIQEWTDGAQKALSDVAAILNNMGRKDDEGDEGDEGDEKN